MSHTQCPILQAPVLVLNKNWTVVGEATVASALTDMNGGSYGQKPSKLAMHVELEPDGEGGWVLGTGTRPIDWDEWIELPIREDHHEDRALHTHRFAFRCPTVIICSVYDQVPHRKMRWSTGNVRLRDGGRCQITNRKLSTSEGNVGHDVARSKGGADSFSNTIWMDKQLNSLQGTRTFAEMGWKPIRAPKAPPTLPVSATIRTAKHVQWTPFLIV